MTLFGPNLRAWRQTRGLTQEELGRLIGVRQSTISAWERGGADPSFRHLERLESVTGLLPDIPAPPPKSPTPEPPSPPDIPHRQARELATLVYTWRARRQDLINRLRYNPQWSGSGQAWQVNERAKIWDQAARELEAVLRAAGEAVAA